MESIAVMAQDWIQAFIQRVADGSRFDIGLILAAMVPMCALALIWRWRRRRRRRNYEKPDTLPSDWNATRFDHLVARGLEIDFAARDWPLPSISVRMQLGSGQAQPDAVGAPDLEEAPVVPADWKRRTMPTDSTLDCAVVGGRPTLTAAETTRATFEDAASTEAELCVQEEAAEAEMISPSPESASSGVANAAGTGQTPAWPHCEGAIPVASLDAPLRAAMSEEADAPVSPSRTENLTLARGHLAAGNPRGAIESLRSTLDAGDASSEAWAIAGWAWWRIANGPDDDGLSAARRATHAFENALRSDAGRSGLLTRVIGRCYVLCAQHESGVPRVHCLDEAVRWFSSHIDESQAVDEGVLVELADALYERAMMALPFERTAWLDRAEQVLNTQLLPVSAGDRGNWIQANVLFARSELADAFSAATLHGRAVDILRSELGALDLLQRDIWLRRWIDAERAYSRRLNGASRLTHLQTVDARVQLPLMSTRSIAPLLSWIGLLGDWAAELCGAAAHERLAEVGSLFNRVEAIAGDDGTSFAFARAHYLRLQLQHERGATRMDTLRRAEQLLERIVPAAATPTLVTLELAELAYASAARLAAADAQKAYLRAAELGEDAAGSPENELRALTCALKSWVAVCQLRREVSAETLARMRKLSVRLLRLAPQALESLRLGAWVNLYDRRYMLACEQCDGAWKAGACGRDVLPVWRAAIAGWRDLLPDPAVDRNFTRLHQRMRLASSTA